MIAYIDGNLPVVKSLVAQRRAEINHIGFDGHHCITLALEGNSYNLISR
ncbi:hypothetical protein [Polynucleobacter necessarius]